MASKSLIRTWALLLSIFSIAVGLVVAQDDSSKNDTQSAQKSNDKLVAKQITKLDKHRDSVTSVAVSPDGKTMVSLSIDTRVRVWDLEKREQRHSRRVYLDFPWMVKFSADGKTFATCGDDGAVIVWDTEQGLPIQTLAGLMADIHSFAYLPDNRIAACGKNGRMGIWNTKTGRALNSWEEEDDRGGVIAANTEVYATTGNNDTLRVYSCDTHELVREFAPRGTTIQGLAVSPAAPVVAAGGYDNKTKLWNYKTGQLVAELDGHDDRVIVLAFSDNGKLLVSGSGDKTAIVWNAKTGERLAQIAGHENWIHGADFADSGRMVITGGWDKSIGVWRLEKAPDN